MICFFCTQWCIFLLLGLESNKEFKFKSSKVTKMHTLRRSVIHPNDDTIYGTTKIESRGINPYSAEIFLQKP